MTELRRLLEHHVATGALPGAVAAVARGDDVETVAIGSADPDGTAPMTRETVFRFASITKPVTAAALLVLVDDRRVALDDPIGRWLPELAAPVAVRTPGSPVDDVVPVARPVTVFDVLTSQAGWGYPSDFGLPAAQALVSARHASSADEWLAELARVPLLYQPGEAWLYDTCSAIQGVLVERVSGTSLPDFLTERVFAPLGMRGCGFRGFPLGAGGLTGTVDDWLAFGRMLLADGEPVLSRESVRLMTTDHTTPAHREIGALFLDGLGWGMGGSVDGTRYGWVGATGTSAHVDAATGTVAILLTRVGADSPEAPGWMRDFWALTS